MPIGSKNYTQRINICIYDYLNSLIIQLNPHIKRITLTIALKRNLFKKNFQQSYRRCLYFEKVEAKQFYKEPIGSGSFRFSKFCPGASIVLVAV